MSDSKNGVELEVVLDGESHKITLNEGETVLEASLRVGLDAPYSCMSGVCTTCQVTVQSGDLEMENNDALSDEEVAQGNYLACQATHKSNKPIKVKYINEW